MATPTVAALEDESPILAALPPNTDYITYLTILEYQLKPSNLSILNGVLQKDDGTLAKEIGWDLLRLVLPMLADEPNEARECLALIANQGNPREVVVRIAEELEKLGHDAEDADEQSEVQEEEDEDGLPTFAGEATRVHLGKMKLDGMPEPKVPEPSNVPSDAMSSHQEANDDMLVFPALLSMLSKVHPRIKTQYPSRFLATSLPAALGAYRRMPITQQSTEAFLLCLGSLAGRQRPPLPVRALTSEQPQPQQPQALLPDPEAPLEAQQGSNVASQMEKDIIRRLLQAVMLEVMDEFIASLQGDELPSMLWTKRLRESTQVRKVLITPGQPTATELFQHPPQQGFEAIMQKFVSLLKLLELDLESQIKRITALPEKPAQNTVATESDDEEPSEYPTSPSQIPFPTTGTVLMLAAAQFCQKNSDATSTDLTTLSRLFEIITPLSDMPKIPNPGVQDALHYLALRSITSNAGGISPLENKAYIGLASILTQIFTITPDPQTRDDAHYVSTKLLYLQPVAALRLDVIKQTIRGEALSPSSREGGGKGQPIPLATPFTEGALKAVGINWLKDELLSSLSPTNSNSNTTTTTPIETLHPSLLQSDPILKSLLFPSSSIAPAPTGSEASPELSTTLLTLPYYIALLNFHAVLISRLTSASSSDNTGTQAGDLGSIRTHLSTQAGELLVTLKSWWVYLIGLLNPSNEGAGGNEDITASAGDVYAFEDAGVRLEGVLGRA